MFNRNRSKFFVLPCKNSYILVVNSVVFEIAMGVNKGELIGVAV